MAVFVSLYVRHECRLALHDYDPESELAGSVDAVAFQHQQMLMLHTIRRCLRRAPNAK